MKYLYTGIRHKNFNDAQINKIFKLKKEGIPSSRLFQPKKFYEKLKFKESKGFLLNLLKYIILN